MNDYDFQPIIAPVDALRVCAVMEKSIEKLQLLSMLTTDVSSFQLKENVESQTSNQNQTKSVASILEEQRKLGARYEALSYQRSNKDQDVFSTLKEQNEKEQELSDIQEKLKDNTRKLCRNLKETPNEMNNWKKVQSERVEIQNVLANSLRELSNGLTPQSKYKHLKTPMMNFNSSTSTPINQRPDVVYELFFKKVKEEIKERQFLQDIQEQEVETNLAVKGLVKEVKKQKELKKFEVEERTQKVNELVNQLRELRKMTQEARIKTEATDDAEYQCRRRQEQMDLQKLEEELLEEEMKLQIEEKVFNRIQDFLNTSNIELVDKGDKWKDKADREMEELKQKLSYWEGIREDQINQKNKLEEEYARETEEMKLREQEEKERLESERKEREDLIHSSSTMIKLCFKAYKARASLDQLKKQAKKRKKKPKKK